MPDPRVELVVEDSGSNERSVAELLNSSDRLDPQLVRSTSVKFSDQLNALISPVSVSFSEPNPLNYDFHAPGPRSRSSPCRFSQVLCTRPILAGSLLSMLPWK